MNLPTASLFLRRVNDSGVAVVFAYALALYGLFATIQFTVYREFLERLMDFSHLPLMFVLAVVTVHSPVFPKRATLKLRMLLTGLFLIAFGAVVEVIQPYFGRTESIVDFRNGAWGTVLGLAAVEVWQRPRWGRRAAYLILLIASTIPSFRPAFTEARGIIWRKWNFPLLADFEAAVELTAWHAVGGGEIQRTREHSAEGSWALRLGLVHGTLPGAEFLPDELDWRGYATLSFEAFVPGPPVSLIVRVDDDGPHATVADRAHGTAALATGSNHIVLSVKALEHTPRNRLLNLAAIRRLVFFTQSQSGPVFLDALRLTH